MKYKFVKFILDFENNKKMLTSQNGDLPYTFIIAMSQLLR
jgi:hypothetical protein